MDKLAYWDLQRDCLKETYQKPHKKCAWDFRTLALFVEKENVLIQGIFKQDDIQTRVGKGRDENKVQGGQKGSKEEG